ncbi:MAG: tyrosine-type recombinase/integrase [Parcubacteria group bacterium]|nr:tyrosine-type recombinase/integrase [Parcubacteria group bacterium]
MALRQFLKYLARRDVASLPADRIELAKQGDRDLDLISAEELGRLLASPAEALAKAEKPEEKLKALRDLAILELLFSTGLRVAELCSLSRYLDWKRDEVSVRGKGDKVRLVFISPKAKQTIKEYLDIRTDVDDALFVNVSRANSASRLTPRSVARIVKEHAIRAGIDKRVSPHTLRHMFATDLLENGADIRSVQALLGHANIATTQVYTHVTDRHLKDIHKTFHGKQRN